MFFGLFWFLAGSGWAIWLPSLAKKPEPAAAVAKPDPESMLIEIYKHLGASRLRDAEAKANELVQAYPDFRLGQLIRGDLLLMRTRPVTTLGAVNGSKEKLGNLREEAMARLQSFRERPHPGVVPRAILRLREDQKHALVVDAKRSRLYVYENRRGQLKLTTDYYISQGKLGVNKLKPGGRKTPIGVYYITSRLPGTQLPDSYGSGALPINYPNEWDRLNDRSGSGVWLHGTSPDSYSHPPHSSGGGVVLPNPDLDKLYEEIEVGKTPIIISEQVEFVNKAKWNRERKLAARLVDEWRRDAESLNPARLRQNYSMHFRSDSGENLATWFEKQRHALSGVKKLSITLRDLTLFLYPGREDLIVGTFTEETRAGKRRSSVRKRQYWAKEGAHWKIIWETNL
ncbi:MAG TPA: L,D-transpeptidase [Burkholderiaceae bacterium]|jgi:hypothetical protein|nr:L,D-transpeptidase [Burkholderiaceae bacterium]